MKHIFSIFVSLTISNLLFSQNIFTSAGNGVAGYSGDSGPAILAEISSPNGVAFDGAGNLFISDFWNYRIRKVDNAGIITTIAGTGSPGNTGNGGQATLAQINSPRGITVDQSGNIYFCSGGCIRKINTSGVITIIAGTDGSSIANGDGGLATSALIGVPIGITADISGNIYITDVYNHRIRKINTSGVINTIVGNGISGFTGDGGLATSARLNEPSSVIVDATGNLYFTDSWNDRIRKVNTSGIISTFVGSGTPGFPGFSGDNGPATSAQLNHPYSLTMDGLGNIYFCDQGNARIRKVNTSGIIFTVAGTGTSGYSGDGGIATFAQIDPVYITMGPLNNIYFSEGFFNNRVRVICYNDCLAGINSTEVNNIQKLIFPNPNNGIFNLLINNELKDCELVLLNPFGQKVHVQKITQGENNIRTYGLAKGLYYYILLQNKEWTSGGKLVIE